VRLFNWTLPAYKSQSGRLICANAKECVKFCYAKKGAYIWSNVRSAHEERYEFSKTPEFVDAMINDILKKKADYVRVHDAGDYYSRAYMQKWFDIARALPHVRFYSYTNMVRMVLAANIPDNFDFIFSDSGKEKRFIDKTKHRHTRIFSLNDSVTDGYVDASNYDLYATKWFSPNNHKVGLIYH
jgi:hypothetical protein